MRRSRFGVFESFALVIMVVYRAAGCSDDDKSTTPGPSQWAWSPLGTGMDNTVFALTVYDNKLIAGGVFTTASGVIVNYIAAWDGSSWSPLGTGMDSEVDAVTVYGDTLIAGGIFTTAGGVGANYIAASKLP